jgi:PAS domain S-box-containing protein
VANRRREAAERILEQFLEVVPDALLLVAADGDIIFANSAATELFGYSLEELVGMLVERLVPAPLAERHVEHRRAYLADPARRLMAASLRVYAVRKDGSQFRAEVWISSTQAAAGQWAAASIRDIGGRVAA